LEGKKSKRGRVREGRPTKRTPEVVAKIAEAVAVGLTDREAGLLAGVRHDTMTEWRKDPEFSEAIERATAQRLLARLGRVEAGEQGWQGTAWALERLHPARFDRPDRQVGRGYNEERKKLALKAPALLVADTITRIGKPVWQTLLLGGSGIQSVRDFSINWLMRG
jgi:hypothetical protein